MVEACLTSSNKKGANTPLVSGEFSHRDPQHLARVWWYLWCGLFVGRLVSFSHDYTAQGGRCISTHFIRRFSQARATKNGLRSRCSNMVSSPRTSSSLNTQLRTGYLPPPPIPFSAVPRYYFHRHTAGNWQDTRRGGYSFILCSRARSPFPASPSLTPVRCLKRRFFATPVVLCFPTSE